MAVDKASSMLSGAKLEPVLKAGAEIVQAAVRGIIDLNAQHPTGQLKKAITFELRPESGRADMGWEKAPIENRKKGGHKVSVYTDARGRRRKVTTVADYARILEYSQRRQLRHMEDGFDLAEGKATAVMEKMADRMLEQAADAAFQ